MFRLLNRLMELSAGDDISDDDSGGTGDNRSAAMVRGIDGALSGRTVTIPESMAARSAGYLIFRLGRGPDNDLSFPEDTTLNPRHLTLYRINGRWFCRDLDTQNGTRAGGRLLRGQSVPLPPGVEIRFGRQAIALEYVSSGSLSTAAPAILASTPAALPRSRQVAGEPFTRELYVPGAEDPAQPWRWVPPGEAVTIKEWTIPGGMVYTGRQLKSLQGHGIEPSLINPNLKVAGRTQRETGRRGYDTYSFYFYGLTYADASPALRRQYLEWLAGGRSATLAGEQLLLLFFYGLERRLIESEGNAAPAGERDLLRAEIERLLALYTEAPQFQRAAANLLHFLDARKLIEDGGPAPDIDALIAQSRAGYSQELPQPLEIALSRMARDKTPLPADYALAWVLNDPEATGALRTAAQRCPDELKQLWILRYTAGHPKGIRIPERKTPLRIAYRPASPTLYGWTGVLAPGGLRAPSPTPLRQLRVDFDACCDALDPLSRFAGRRPELRSSPLAAALLPQELRDASPAVNGLVEALAARVPEEAGVPVSLSGAELISALTGGAGLREPLGRAESQHAAVLLESIGMALEPDVRRGGSPLAATETAILARLGPDAAAGEEAVERDRRLRPLSNLLAGVVSDALAMAGKDRLPDLLRSLPGARLAAALAATAGEGEPARFAVHLAWLFEDTSRIRASRQGAAFAPLSGPVRAKLGALLTDTAADIARLAASPGDGRSFSGGGQPSPALVRRLATAYRILGLEEASLYDRLHHRTTLSAVAGGDAALPSLQAVTGPVVEGAAIPGESDPGRPITLDAGAIRRKEAETAQVSQLLNAIFEEPGEAQTAPVRAPEPSTEDSAAAEPEVSPVSGSGRLDAAHAALLAELIAEEEWSGDDFAARARAHGLLPGAALETINEVAWEIADEPALEGSDPVYVNSDAARAVLG